MLGVRLMLELCSLAGRWQGVVPRYTMRDVIWSEKRALVGEPVKAHADLVRSGDKVGKLTRAVIVRNIVLDEFWIVTFTASKRVPNILKAPRSAVPAFRESFDLFM